MNRQLLAAGAVALVVAGCAPASGEVVDRSYAAPYTYTTEQCSYTAQPNGQSIRTCVPVSRYVAESYRLRLDDGQDAGWRSVPEGEYDRCHVGDQYPNCASGGSR